MTTPLNPITERIERAVGQVAHHSAGEAVHFVRLVPLEPAARNASHHRPWPGLAKNARCSCLVGLGRADMCGHKILYISGTVGNYTDKMGVWSPATGDSHQPVSFLRIVSYAK